MTSLNSPWITYDGDLIHAVNRLGSWWECEACGSVTEDQAEAIRHAVANQFTPGGPRPLTPQERRVAIGQMRAA